MSEPFIPTEKQFLKLQKLCKCIKNRNDIQMIPWLVDMDKIYYAKCNGNWLSFVSWAKGVNYDWSKKFEEANELWKNIKKEK